MGKWETTPEGTRIYTYNPTKVAYKIMLLLEAEKVPYGEVENIFRKLQGILSYQKIVHSPEEENNPSWPI